MAILEISGLVGDSSGAGIFHPRLLCTEICRLKFFEKTPAPALTPA